MGLLRRGDTPAQITIVEEPDREGVPQTGAVSSVQQAELEMPAEVLEEMWQPEYLERLARAYWRWLNRISLGLLRVVYEPAARVVVLLFRPLALLRFRAPEYDPQPDHASVTWPIERGLLVGKDGRDKGYLRIAVRRLDGAPPGRAPALRGGRGLELLSVAARIGALRPLRHLGLLTHAGPHPRARHPRLPALAGAPGPAALARRRPARRDRGGRPARSRSRPGWFAPERVGH